MRFSPRGAKSSRAIPCGIWPAFSSSAFASALLTRCILPPHWFGAKRSRVGGSLPVAMSGCAARPGRRDLRSLRFERARTRSAIAERAIPKGVTGCAGHLDSLTHAPLP